MVAVTVRASPLAAAARRARCVRCRATAEPLVGGPGPARPEEPKVVPNVKIYEAAASAGFASVAAKMTLDGASRARPAHSHPPRVARSAHLTSPTHPPSSPPHLPVVASRHPELAAAKLAELLPFVGAWRATKSCQGSCQHSASRNRTSLSHPSPTLVQRSPATTSSAWPSPRARWRWALRAAGAFPREGEAGWRRRCRRRRSPRPRSAPHPLRPAPSPAAPSPATPPCCCCGSRMFRLVRPPSQTPHRQARRDGWMGTCELTNAVVRERVPCLSLNSRSPAAPADQC